MTVRRPRRRRRTGRSGAIRAAQVRQAADTTGSSAHRPNGDKIPGAAIRQALRLSAGEPVAVVTIARIYGSSLGLPNPGLMPTRKEMEEQKEIATDRVGPREGRGGGRGQVAATRKPSKTIAQAAVARGVRHVLVVRPGEGRLAAGGRG